MKNFAYMAAAVLLAPWQSCTLTGKHIALWWHNAWFGYHLRRRNTVAMRRHYNANARLLGRSEAWF